MTTYLFPGQGSQYKGMGESLFDAFPEFTAEADEILGYSISTLCLEDPNRQLSQTQYTQPALYVVNALSYQHQLLQTPNQPDYVAGHSLGEYNALHASGALSFADGLKLVQKRGELMSQAPKGAMAAIVKLNTGIVSEVLRAEGLDIDIANYNAPTQTVIAGSPEDLAKAQGPLEEAGGMFLPLNTSGAFHSRYMAAARDTFADYLKDFQFGELTIPVIANIDAKPYQADQIFHNLSEQLMRPVQWLQTIDYLLNQGETDFKELGPGDVLTKLTATIRQVRPVETAAKADTLSADTANASSATASAPAEATSRPTATPAAKAAEPAIDPIAQLGLEPGSLNADTEAAYRQKIAAVQQRIADWNRDYPVGTPVTVKGYDEPLETRTRAMLLFGHRAAIYLKDYNGYFHLDDVTPVTTSTTAGVSA